MIDEKRLIEDIRKLDSYVVQIGKDETLVDIVLLDDVKRTINKQPQADKWIPCSERLPSEAGHYLVTTIGFFQNVVNTIYFDSEMWHSISKVLAWQPLPQPYKKEVQSNGIHRM